MRAVALGMVLLCGIAQAAEPPDADRPVGEDRKAAVVAQTKQQIVELEKQRVAAVKRRDGGLISALVNDIRLAKIQLKEALKKTVEDYAREADAEAEEAARKADAEAKEAARTLNEQVVRLLYEGKYAEAEPLALQALEVSLEQNGPDHPQTATSLYNLAWLYYDQGKYELAEPLYKRSLAIYEKVLGPDHPDTATSLGGLAYLYYTQGKYDLAEHLYKRALAIYEKVLGSDHASTASGLGGLALLYYDQGKYDLAEPLYKRALAIYEKIFGPDNTDTPLCQ